MLSSIGSSFVDVSILFNRCSSLFHIYFFSSCFFCSLSSSISLSLSLSFHSGISLPLLIRTFLFWFPPGVAGMCRFICFFFLPFFTFASDFAVACVACTTSYLLMTSINCMNAAHCCTAVAITTTRERESGTHSHIQTTQFAGPMKISMEYCWLCGMGPMWTRISSTLRLARPPHCVHVCGGMPKSVTGVLNLAVD